MFAGVLSRGAYARAAAIRIAAFVVATTALPFILSTLFVQANCAAGAGGCLALAVIVLWFVKPAAYLLFVLSFIRISVRRLRDLGLPVALVIMLPTLMLGDVMFGITVGHRTEFMAASGLQWPRYLFAALVCVVFLCLVPSADQAKENRGDRWGIAGAIALGILVLMCIGAVVRVMDSASWLAGDAGRKLFREALVIYGLYSTPAILVALLAFVAWRQLRVS